MNDEHAELAQWDAAYVLGALSAADRRVFEEHLDGCDRCVRAVAEIAPTLGLMAHVDGARAAALLDGAEDGYDGAGRAAGRERLLAAAARRRRRRGGWWGAGLAAAAAVVIAVVVSVSTVLAPAQGGTLTAELVAVADIPLTASVEVTPAEWGSRIDLECRYDGDSGWPYALVVTDRDGIGRAVSTWRAVPGRTVRLAAATDLDPAQIATIEIRPVDRDDVLMRADLDPE